MIEKRTIVKFVLTIVIVVFVLVVVSGYYVYLNGKNNGYDKGFEDGHKRGVLDERLRVLDEKYERLTKEIEK